MKRVEITTGRRNRSGRMEKAKNVLEVNVEPGSKAGTIIEFPNSGDEFVTGQAQTILFVIEEMPHAVYKRDGDDLSADIEISPVEAFNGFSKDLKTLDGRILRVTSQPDDVVEPGHVILFTEEGMPNQCTGRKGNLHVKLDVKSPKTANLSVPQPEIPSSQDPLNLQSAHDSNALEYLSSQGAQTPGMQVTLDVGFPFSSESKLLSILCHRADEIYDEVDKLDESEFAIGLDHLSQDFMLVDAEDEFHFSGTFTEIFSDPRCR
jgi:DnaJ-class molecular chaperone